MQVGVLGGNVSRVCGLELNSCKYSLAHHDRRPYQGIIIFRVESFGLQHVLKVDTIDTSRMVP